MDYQRPRLKVLSDYYEGKTKNLVELTRRKEEYMADNRVAHDYASYISDFINGYFLGNPVQYQDDDGTESDLLQNVNEVSKYIEHRMDYQRPRLKVLSDYYEGKTKNLVELTRRKEEY
ncbi:phage portal protein, partial [Staphylococcus aureus]